MYEVVRPKPVRGCPRVNLPQACRHETQWRRRRCTQSAKEFLVLLPKPLYYSLKHIFIWHEGFLELYKRLKITWLQAGAVCRMFAYLPFQLGVHLVRNLGLYGRGPCVTGWCCQWVFRMFILWSLYTDLKRFTVAFGFTLSLRDLKSRYPSGPVRIDSSLRTPTSSCAAVSSALLVHAVKCNALPKYLEVIY